MIAKIQCIASAAATTCFSGSPVKLQIRTSRSFPRHSFGPGLRFVHCLTRVRSLSSLHVLHSDHSDHPSNAVEQKILVNELERPHRLSKTHNRSLAFHRFRLASLDLHNRDRWPDRRSLIDTCDSELFVQCRTWHCKLRSRSSSPMTPLMGPRPSDDIPQPNSCDFLPWTARFSGLLGQRSAPYTNIGIASPCSQHRSYRLPSTTESKDWAFALRRKPAYCRFRTRHCSRCTRGRRFCWREN